MTSALLARFDELATPRVISIGTPYAASIDLTDPRALHALHAPITDIFSRRCVARRRGSLACRSPYVPELLAQRASRPKTPVRQALPRCHDERGFADGARARRQLAPVDPCNAFIRSVRLLARPAYRRNVHF